MRGLLQNRTKLNICSPGSHFLRYHGDRWWAPPRFISLGCLKKWRFECLTKKWGQTLEVLGTASEKELLEEDAGYSTTLFKNTQGPDLLKVHMASAATKWQQSRDNEFISLTKPFWMAMCISNCQQNSVTHSNKSVCKHLEEKTSRIYHSSISYSCGKKRSSSQRSALFATSKIFSVSSELVLKHGQTSWWSWQMEALQSRACFWSVQFEHKYHCLIYQTTNSSAGVECLVIIQYLGIIVIIIITVIVILII